MKPRSVYHLGFPVWPLRWGAPHARPRAWTSHAPTQTGKHCVFLFAFVLAVACAAPALVAQDYGDGKAKPPPAATPATAEQLASLRAVDVRIAGLEALLPKIDDAAQKSGVVSGIADFRKRRAALEKNFDPGLQEALMHAVISRYQTTALWLTPPRTLPPATAAKPSAAKPSASSR